MQAILNITREDYKFLQKEYNKAVDEEKEEIHILLQDEMVDFHVPYLKYLLEYLSTKFK